MSNPKRVFYNGRPFEYTVTTTDDGKRHYSLFKKGVLAHFVSEDQLDNRWPLTIMLDNYITEVKLAIPA